ncbi:hypothetical protein T08_6332 [Trichinella sp. T8]|nr:hypothetical protein T08_6332 [Trichinella sp. T8]
MSYKNVGVICSDCQRRIAFESQNQAVQSLGGVRLGKSVLEPIYYIAALISV